MAKKTRPIVSMVLHKHLHAIKGLPAEATVSDLKFKGVRLEEVGGEELPGVMIYYGGQVHKIPSTNIAQIYYGPEEPKEAPKSTDK